MVIKLVFKLEYQKTSSGMFSMFEGSKLSKFPLSVKTIVAAHGFLSVSKIRLLPFWDDHNNNNYDNEID